MLLTPISFFFLFNRLLKAAASALVPGSIEFIETVQEIRLDHLDACKKHISDADILKRVQDEINQDCDRLRAFLEAAQVIHPHPNRFAFYLYWHVSMWNNGVTEKRAYHIQSWDCVYSFPFYHNRLSRRFRQDPKISLWQ